MLNKLKVLILLLRKWKDIKYLINELKKIYSYYKIAMEDEHMSKSEMKVILNRVGKIIQDLGRLI